MDKMLSYAWGEYRAWAITSRRLKARLGRWSAIVLALTLGGTALGSMAPLLREGSWLAAIVPLAGAAALALATFFATQVLSDSERQGWVKARALAEALKSESYKYATGVPPYDGDDASRTLGAKVADAQRLMSGVLAESIAPEERARNIPDVPFSIDQYIEHRLREQIDRYYRPAIARHTAALQRARIVALVVGAAAVVLSASGTTLGGVPAALLGLVTTAGAAIAAWFQTGRHQQLALNYQAAVARLELLLAQHAASGSPDATLVLEAEAMFQAEHASWLAEWQATPASQTQNGSAETGRAPQRPEPGQHPDPAKI